MRGSEERREHTHIRGVPVGVIMPTNVDLLMSFQLVIFENVAQVQHSNRFPLSRVHKAA